MNEQVANDQIALYDVSVIIPVYNTAPYLEECLSSVLADPLASRCEILLIDDGSTDGSPDVLRQYEDQYANFRVLRYAFPPLNRGPSAARNLGLRYASGRYVFFLDSDDVIRDGYISSLYSKAEEARCDIVCGGFSFWTADSIREVPRALFSERGIISGGDFLNLRFDRGDRYYFSCCMLFRTAFLRKLGLLFEEELWIYEDILFTSLAASSADRVAFSEHYGYLYRRRSDGLTGTPVYIRDVEAVLLILDRIKTAAMRDASLYRLSYDVISMCLYYIGLLSEERVIDSQTCRHYYRDLSEWVDWRLLWKAAQTPREKLKWILWRIHWGTFYPMVKRRNAKSGL